MASELTAGVQVASERGLEEMLKKHEVLNSSTQLVLSEFISKIPKI